MVLLLRNSLCLSASIYYIYVMNKKIDSLKTLQNIINRLEKNSFANKGWLIVLISTLVTVSYSQPLLRHSLYSAILFVVIIVLFWFCDAYYKGLVQHYRELSNNLAGELARDSNYLQFLQKIKGIKYCNQYELAFRNMLIGDVAPFYITLSVAMMLFVFATPSAIPTSKPAPVDSVYVNRKVDELKTFMDESIVKRIDSQTEIVLSIKDSLSTIRSSTTRKSKASLPPCEKYVRMNVCKDTIIQKSDVNRIKY